MIPGTRIMKAIAKFFPIIILTLVSLNCKSQKVFKSKIVYKSKGLTITQVTSNSFVHTSFKQTRDFGYVPCNGLIVRNSNETVVFDTPTNDSSSLELIKWIKDSIHCKINAIVPTHFHDDCLGGLKAFHDNLIPSHANMRTIELAKDNSYEVPQNGFKDSLILKVGTKISVAKFFGEGHTMDNIVGYFPDEGVLFGGCLVKELNAAKGYLGDANINEWSNTVKKVKAQYPRLKIVVPGHGKHGDKALLDYTIRLFKTQ